MIGSVVNCYGRSLVIVDCDEFTRHYYREKYGVNYFEPIPEDVFHDIDYETGAAIESTHQDEPALNADEDPENLRALVPKPAKKDFKKMLKYDNTVMRFVAKLDSGKQVDKDRHFILSFYMADDTFQVKLHSKLIFLTVIGLRTTTEKYWHQRWQILGTIQA